MDDLEPTPSLAEKRRRYFAARDKNMAEKKGFRKLAVESEPQGPQFVMVLLCLLGMALVIFQIFGPALYQEDDEEITDVFPIDELEADEATGARVDPKPMQSYLIRLELALFEPPSGESFESIVGGLWTEIDRLSEFLKSTEQERQEALATELDAMALPLRDESFDLAGLGALQDQWLQFRARSFQAAPWFKSRASTLKNDQAAYAVYRDLADQLLRLVGTGLSDAEDVIEEGSEIGTLESDQPARQALLEGWKQTAAEWRAEIESLRRGFPERPAPSAPNAVLDAIHQLETVIRESLDRLPADRLPTSSDLASLEEVLASAQLAVEAFEVLE